MVLRHSNGSHELSNSYRHQFTFTQLPFQRDTRLHSQGKGVSDLKISLDNCEDLVRSWENLIFFPAQIDLMTEKPVPKPVFERVCWQMGGKIQMFTSSFRTFTINHSWFLNPQNFNLTIGRLNIGYRKLVIKNCKCN